MKNIMKSLMLVAVAAMGFVSCSNKFEEENIQSGKTFSLVISAEKPVLESDMRTEFKDGSVVWSSDDKIRVAYKEDNGKWSKYYASNEAQSEDDFKTATFALNSNFTSNEDNYPTEGATYTFYAGYPSTVIGSSTNAPSNDALSVKVATEQTMKKAGTFDATADIMVGVSSEYNEWPTEPVGLTFARLVAHGCVTLKNFAAEENETVKSVTFTAPEGVNLTGSGSVNFVEQTMTALDSNTVKVTLPANTLATSDVVVWFCSAPATIASGANLTVVVETSRGTYTRTITANANGIKFLQNRYNTLGINMATATFEAAEVVEGLADGDYVMMVKDGSTYYAVSVENQDSNGRRRNFVSVEYNSEESTYSTDNENIVWTIAKQDGSYTISNGDKFMYLSTNSNYAYVSNNSSTYTSNNNHLMTITANDDGTYHIVPNNYSARELAKNGTNGFAFYNQTSNYIADFYLIPVVEDTTPKLIVKAQPEEVAAAGANVTVALTVANLTENITVTPSETWITNATVSGSNLTFTVAANDVEQERTATITLKSGDLTATVNVKQEAKQAENPGGGSESSVKWVKVTSASDITAGGEYVLAAKHTSGTYAYIPNAAVTSSGVTLKSSTVLSGTEIDDSNVSADMKWTLVASGSGFKIQSSASSSNILYTNSGTGNNVRISNGSTRNEWTFTVDNSYGWKISNGTHRLAVYSATSLRNYGASTTTNQNGTFIIFKKSN